MMPDHTPTPSIAESIQTAKLGFQNAEGEFEPCRISLTPYQITAQQWADAQATARALNQLHLALSHHPEILLDMIAPLRGGGTLPDALAPYLVAAPGKISATAVNLCRHDFLLDSDGHWRLVESNAIAAGMGPFSEKCADIQRAYPANRALEFADNPAIATQSAALFDAAKNNRNADHPRIIFVVEPNENNVFDQGYLADALRDQGADVRFLTLAGLQQQLSARGEDLVLADGQQVDLFYFRTGYNLADYNLEDNKSSKADLLAYRAWLELHRVAVCPSISAQVASSKWVQKELSSRLQTDDLAPWMTEFGLDQDGHALARRALAVAYRDITEQSSLANPENWLLKNQNEGGGNVQTLSHENLEDLDPRQGWFLMQKIACHANTDNKAVFSAGRVLNLTDTITEVGVFCAGDDAHYAGYLARSKARSSLETGVHSGQGMVDAIAFK